jgi:hypothetical protein
MSSPFLSLNSKDFLKGLFMAVLTSVITLIYTSIQEGSLTVNWNQIGMVALSTTLAYITKNLLTNSGGELMKKESAPTMSA